MDHVSKHTKGVMNSIARFALKHQERNGIETKWVSKSRIHVVFGKEFGVDLNTINWTGEIYKLKRRYGKSIRERLEYIVPGADLKYDFYYQLAKMIWRDRYKRKLTKTPGSCIIDDTSHTS